MTTAEGPALVLVGSGERMGEALAEALERRGAEVITCDVAGAAEAVRSAPDLVVLMGDAAADGGHAMGMALRTDAASALSPLVLLTDRAEGTSRGVFQHGVVGAVRRSASADGMAREVLSLARELPGRSGEAGGEVRHSEFPQLISLVSARDRAGILTVSAGDEGGESAQVVLGPGRDPAEVLAELVERMRPLVAAQPETLRYEFHESPASRLAVLDSGPDAPAEIALPSDDEGERDDAELLRGRRVLLIEDHPVRADLLGQELRARGALVIVTDGRGTGLARASAHDPEVVLMDDSGMDSWALPALRQVRRDPRLRWSSLLVMDMQALIEDDSRVVGFERVLEAARPLLAPDRELALRAADEPDFDTRLELLGPSRLLRALVDCGVGLRLTVRHPRVRVELDLIESLVAGARALHPVTMRVLGEGPAALTALLGLRSGRVHVARAEAPQSANIMAPVQDALIAAARERAPVPPSDPPPSVLDMETVKREPPEASAPAALLTQFESLLAQLQQVLPEGAGQPAAPKPSPAVSSKKVTLPGVRLDAARAAKEDVAKPSVAKVGVAKVGAVEPAAPKSEKKRTRPGFTLAPEEPSGDSPPTGPKLARDKSRRRGTDAFETPNRGTERPLVPPPKLPRPAFQSEVFDSDPGLSAVSAPDEEPEASGSFANSMISEASLERVLPSGILGARTEGAAEEPAPEEPAPEEPAPEEPAPEEPAPEEPAPEEPAAGEPAQAEDAAPADDAPAPAPTSEASASPPPSGDAEPPRPERPGDSPRASVPSRRATMVLGTVSKVSDVHESQPPAPIRDPEAPAPGEPAEGATDDEGLHTQKTQPPGPRSDAPSSADERDEPEAHDDEDLEEFEAVAVPGKLTPPPSLGAAFVPKKDPSGFSAGAPAVAAIASEPPGRRPSMPPREDETQPTPPVAKPQPAPAPAPASRALVLGAAAIAAVGVLAAVAGGIMIAWGGDEPASSAEPPAPEPPTAPAEPPPPTEPAAVPTRLTTTAVDLEAELITLPPATGRVGQALRRRDIDFLIHEANVSRRREELGEAELLYLRVLSLDRDNPRAIAGLARVAMIREDGPRAVYFAQALAAIRPRIATNHILVGDALELAGDHEAARAAWRQALELSPRHAGVLRRLAQ